MIMMFVIRNTYDKGTAGRSENRCGVSNANGLRVYNKENLLQCGKNGCRYALDRSVINCYNSNDKKKLLQET